MMFVKYMKALFFLCLINSVNGQNVLFEELAPVPEVSIQDMFVSKYNTIYMKTGDGWYWSTDDGKSWDKRELPMLNIREVVFMDSGQAIFHTLFEGDFTIGPNGWTQLNNPDSLASFRIITFNDKVVRQYASGIYFSDKLGNNMSKLTLPQEDLTLQGMYSSDTRLHLVVQAEGVSDFMTLIYDESLTLINTSTLPDYDEDTYIVTEDFFITGDSYKLYASFDDGTSFLSRDLVRTNGSNLAYVSGDLYLAISANGYERGLHFMDMNNFENGMPMPIGWTGINLVLHSGKPSSLFVNSSLQFAHLDLQSSLELTFQDPAISATRVNLNKIMAKNEALYVSTYRFVYKSIDHGKSWTRLGREVKGVLIDYDISDTGEVIVSLGGPDLVYTIDSDNALVKYSEIRGGGKIYYLDGSSEFNAIRPTNCGDVGGTVYSSKLDKEIYLNTEDDCIQYADDPFIFNDKVYFPHLWFSTQEMAFISDIDNRYDLRVNLRLLPDDWPADFVVRNSFINKDGTYYALDDNRLIISEYPWNNYELKDLSFDSFISKPSRLYQNPLDKRIIGIGGSNFYYQENDSFSFRELPYQPEFRFGIQELIFDDLGDIIVEADRKLYKIHFDLEPLSNQILHEENDLLLFPNPASDILTVQLGDYKWQSMTVYNALGEDVINEVITGPEFTIKLSNLESGIYFLKFRSLDRESESKSFNVIK